MRLLRRSWPLQAALLLQLAMGTQLVMRTRPNSTAAQNRTHRSATQKEQRPTLRPLEQRAMALLQAEPQLTPAQFLITSSKTGGKIAWCELKNFRWTAGQSFTLIDSGLTGPAGIAYDPLTGFLYVADPGSLSVYGYRLALVNRKLTTVGTRVTILTNRSVDWITIDPVDSGLFFADKNSNTINKLSAATVNELAFGDLEAEFLPVVHISDVPVQEAKSVRPRIVEIYNANSSQHVTAPSSVVSDGMHLFWLNSAPSEQSGELVKGLGIPKKNASVAQTAAVVNSTGFIPGSLASSRTYMFWSGVNPSKGTTSIFATRKTGAHYVYKMGVKLGNPRGLAWDGDNTLFVADEADGNVYSMPVGRVQLDPPLTRAMQLPGAYGVTVVFESDVHVRR